MADETNLTAGDNAEDIIAGKKNQQQRNEQHANPRQNMRSDNNYYNGDNSQQWIVAQINDHAQQIRELTYRLDDLPNRFNKLEGRVDVQTDKVARLEDLEVVVRKEEVIVRPLPPVAATFSIHTLAIGMIITAVLILIAVSYLIYLQWGRGG